MADQDKPLIDDMPADKVTDGKKQSTSKSSAKKKKPTPQYKQNKIAEEFTQLYATLGTVLYPFDPQCATTVIENSEKMAQSLDNLARENAAARRVLTGIVEGGAWGGVMMAHAPVLLAVATHHAPGLKQSQPTSQTPNGHSTHGGGGVYEPHGR